MRLLLLLVPFILNAWTFKLTDIDNYSQKQLETLRVSYLVGYEKDLHLTLTSIAVVESRAGKFDFNDNHICGAHQLNTDFTESTCESLESNPFVSALEARDNFMYWYRYSGSWRQAIKHYNGGFNTTTHGKEYLRRVLVVMKQIKEHEQLFLHKIGL